MGSTEKKKDGREDEKTREARSLLRIRGEAAYGIAAGMQSATRGPVNIESVELKPNSIYSVMFAHNPNLERSSVGGLALLWVLIPRVDEKDEASDTLEELRPLLRKDQTDEDLSKN